MGTRDLPNMHAPSPRALGMHIRQIPRAHATTINYPPAAMPVPSERKDEDNAFSPEGTKESSTMPVDEVVNKTRQNTDCIKHVNDYDGGVTCHPIHITAPQMASIVIILVIYVFQCYNYFVIYK